MKRSRLLIVSLFLACQPMVKAQLTYTVVDLGTFGGTTSAGNAVNMDGQVAGAAYVTDDAAQNTFISGVDGALPLRNLGTLGGADSFGLSINATGRVTGTSRFTDASFRAFLSGPNGGALVGLGTLGGSNSYAYGVNGSGQVAGYSLITGNGATHAFLSAANGGTLKDLNTLPGGTSSFGSAVNASGQVTGYSGTTSGFNHAFISDANGGVLHDLGTLGGRFSFGVAINDSGQVAGRSEGTSGQHAFRSAPNGGPLFDLGTLGGLSSFGEGINNAGAVVGYSYLSDNSTQHAFIYTTQYGMRDMNLLLVPGSGWILTDARGINDRGQVTGTGMIGGKVHAFLATPVRPDLRITSITALANGHILVKGFGAPFQQHYVEASGDLTEPFVRLATIVAGSDGSLQFEDSDAAQFARSFYRFVFP